MSMDSVALYNLSPTLRLMLMGLVLALGPLAWLWLRQRQHQAVRRLQGLTLLTLFLTFDLILFGAFTRLTDSGLGCPDWPGCYGNASPVGAQAEIRQAEQALPSGPVTQTKAWIEMIHRYLATAVGVLILVLTAATWRARRLAPGSLPISPWWATATLVWVCIQGAFGALTVTMKLFPAIVTLHLLGGILLLVLLAVQAQRYAQALQARAAPRMPAALRHLLWLGLTLLTIQLALGGWVSTNYAVLACTEFPKCQGSWWPPMDFDQGFELWRALGFTADGAHISFAALTAIHYAHRLMAYLVIAVLLLLAWRLRAQAGWRDAAGWLIFLVVLQLLTGLGNVVLGWPLLAAVLHTGGAAALAMVLASCLARSRSTQAEYAGTLPTSGFAT